MTTTPILEQVEHSSLETDENSFMVYLYVRLGPIGEDLQ